MKHILISQFSRNISYRPVNLTYIKQVKKMETPHHHICKYNHECKSKLEEFCTRQESCPIRKFYDKFGTNWKK